VEPALIDALVDALEVLLPDVAVSDCYSLVNDPRDALFVGIADPGSATARAAASSIEWAGETRSGGRTQRGTVTLHALAERGDDDIRAARARAYELVGVVDELARQGWARTSSGGLVVLLQTAMVPAGEAPALDVRVPGVLSLALTSTNLDQAQPSTGAEAAVTFDLGYTARI